MDMKFVLTLTDSVSQCPSMPLSTAAPALGDQACVWDDEKHIYSRAGDYSLNQVELIFVVGMVNNTKLVMKKLN
jgi:hypothetical protein